MKKEPGHRRKMLLLRGFGFGSVVYNEPRGIAASDRVGHVCSDSASTEWVSLGSSSLVDDSSGLKSF